jgi:hypothetical protein
MIHKNVYILKNYINKNMLKNLKLFVMQNNLNTADFNLLRWKKNINELNTIARREQRQKKRH